MLTLPVPQHISKRFVTLSFILILSFSMAPIDAVGMPIALPKLLLEGLSWLLLAWALCLSRRYSKKHVYCWEITSPLLLLSFIGFCGSLLYDEGVWAGMLFVRTTLSCLPLFIALQNITLTKKERQTLCKCIVLLFLLQLPISWIKATIYGVSETHWIGSAHNDAGELGLLIPLFAISVLTTIYLFLRLPKLKTSALLAIIIGFGIFGVIAEKRAILYMFPIWLLITLTLYLLWYYRHMRGTSSLLQLFIQTISLATISLILALIAMTFIPSLNPEEKRGGSISLTHLKNYTYQYLFRGYNHPLNNPIENIKEDGGIQMGRFRVTFEAFRMVAGSNMPTALFGFGGSAISPSHLLGKDRYDIMFEKFQIRGPIAGITRVVVETGLLGLAVMTGWFCWLSILLLRRFLQAYSTDEAAGALSILLIHGVFVFDFFVYSNASWTFGVLSPSYFLLLALHFQRSLTMSDFGVHPPKAYYVS